MDELGVSSIFVDFFSPSRYESVDIFWVQQRLFKRKFISET